MGWRIMMKSFFIASSVLPVSMSVSPFATDEELAAILMVVAPMYFAASSKLVRVRVLFS